MPVCCSGFTRRGGLVRPASKSDCFSHHPLRVPKAWHRDFAACGQRSGLLALNLANIFEKLLDQKTFCCLRLVSLHQNKKAGGYAASHTLPASFLFKNWLIRLPSSFSSESLSVFPHHAASATKPTGSVQSRWNDKYQPEYQLPSEWQSAESNPIP